MIFKAGLTNAVTKQIYASFEHLIIVIRRGPRHWIHHILASTSITVASIVTLTWLSVEHLNFTVTVLV